MGTRKLKRNMVQAVCGLLEDGHEIISIDSIQAEVATNVAALLDLSETAARHFREDVIEALPDVKKRVEDIKGITLIPVTEYCLKNYVENSDGRLIIGEILSEKEADKCVAGGGRINGDTCRTAGYTRDLPNLITRAYLLHQEASATGQGVRHKGRMNNLITSLGQDRAAVLLSKPEPPLLSGDLPN